MRTATPSEPDRLEDLLANLERDPLELVRALENARQRSTAGNGRVRRELSRTELDFLQRRAADPRAGQVLRDAVGLAVDAARRARERELLAAPPADATSLFDLAELRAELRFTGDEAGAERVARSIAERVDGFASADEELCYEASERYAALATGEEDRPLRHQILLLEETQSLIARLSERVGGDRLLDRLSRRLARKACDRVLQLRLERLLTRRGAVALETISLSLLIVLFGLLAIEFSVGPQRWLLIADASICTFFIAEFGLKLALAPARGSWFLRNALTDLLPAIPAALWLITPVPGGELTPLARALRFLRIAWFARYVQALRPALRMVRLALFLVRGSDALVRRFSHLLNRDFVFFERGVMPLGNEPDRDPRTTIVRAIRREHVLLRQMEPELVEPILIERAHELVTSFDDFDGDVAPRQTGASPERIREIPVEHAIEFLWRLEPSEVALWLPRQDIEALDRMNKVLNAPVVRLLPVVRSLRVARLAPTPEERIVAFGRNVAGILERWRDRALHVADLHGIVSGPQVLDRVASGLIRASQRPAVRLLLFGGLFALVRWILGADSALGALLARFVATPLVVLGAVCLVLLALGRWLKALAGQASDVFALTSEAHFHGLVELVKRRMQDEDVQFLARRVFSDRADPWEAAAHVEARAESLRTGRPPSAQIGDDALDDSFDRCALLYLHFLDGAPLHENDVKTTEQLLANLSLQNVRNGWLGWTKRDHKRLWQLAPGEGTLFRGPSIWFRFITDSVAVEVARRVTDYNRHCLTLARRRDASAAERRAFAHWLRRRRSPDADLLERAEGDHGGPEVFATTDFHALDFLTHDVHREEHLARAFGRGVVALLRADREHMIREIFGTRPLDRLPRMRRTINFYRFYQTRLAGGRMFLLPLYGAWLTGLGVRMVVAKTTQVVREILAPEVAIAHRERGRASFAVALRKIHRMKAPTLLETMRTRAAFDPAYAGAPLDWITDTVAERPDLVRDLDFLGMRERHRAEILEVAECTRVRVEELRQVADALAAEVTQVGSRPPLAIDHDGQRAVTIAYATDAAGLRTLLRAHRWFEDTLPVMEDATTELPGYLPRRCLLWVCRGFRRHPVARWLRDHHAGRRISRRGRSNFVRAWHDGDEELRRTVSEWSKLAPGTNVRAAALDRLRAAWQRTDEAERELVALRTVQSLSVLDVRNYRRIVFDLGGYERDGEDPTMARSLP